MAVGSSPRTELWADMHTLKPTKHKSQCTSYIVKCVYCVTGPTSRFNETESKSWGKTYTKSSLSTSHKTQIFRGELP